MNAPAERKLIVAILARGMAHEVAKALHEQRGIETFHYGHGRNAGMIHMIATRDLVEIDFLSVVVDEARAEEIFGFMFEAGRIDEPGGGMLFQMPLSRAATVPLPLAASESESN